MPSHRAESTTPRRRTDRPDISERRQARAAAPTGPDPRAVEHAAQFTGRLPYGAQPVPVGVAVTTAYEVPAPPPQLATFAPADVEDDVEAHFHAFSGPVAPARTARPALPDGYGLGGADVFPVPAAASVVKGGPQQPLTRAQLRAAEGPLTSRSARRQAEKLAAKQAGRTSAGPVPAGRSAAPAKAAGKVPAKASGKQVGRGLSLPQVGVAGALGLATIAAPLTGALSVPAPQLANDPLPVASAEAPAAAFPIVGAPQQSSVLAATLVPGVSDASVVPGTLAAPRTIIVTRASRDSERSVLPGCDGSVPANANWSNGQIPTKQLCTLWNGKDMLRADAAVALAKLNIAYKKRFGHTICLTDSYRTLSEQRHLKAIKPGLAATPGTSNHGWGVAIDMCDGVENYGSATYRWMRDNAPAYGWENPDWALPGGPGPFEPWHWEYMPGEKVGPGSD